MQLIHTSEIVRILSIQTLKDIFNRYCIKNNIDSNIDIKLIRIRVADILKENKEEYNNAIIMYSKTILKINKQICRKREYVSSLHLNDIIPLTIKYPMSWDKKLNFYSVSEFDTLYTTAKIIKNDINSIEIIDNIDISMMIDDKEEIINIKKDIVLKPNMHHSKYESKVVRSLMKDNKKYSIIIKYSFDLAEFILDIKRRDKVMMILEEFGIYKVSRIISEYIT